ncbi:MAG: prolyl oligopeptidase family serine peptidase [Bacteroidota bacterium]
MKNLVFALPFIFCFQFLVGQLSYQNIDLEKGKFEVGYQHLILHDSSRTYKRNGDWTTEHIARPIPLSIWYPGEEAESEEPTLQVLDYMEVLKQEEEWEYLPKEQILNWFYYANTPQNQKHLEEVCWAKAGISRQDGQFPIIIYAPSYQASSVENFGLCEMLASHGFIILSSPSRGAGQRWMEGGTTRDMETQARDLEFMIQYALSLPQTDKDRIAMAGFSFGGISQALVQMRNDHISALVSLDGTERYVFSTLQKSAFTDMDQVDVPYIHMAQKEIPQAVMEAEGMDPKLNTEFLYFDELTNSEAYSLRFHDMTHSYFSTLGVLFQKRDPRQDKSDTEIMASYKLVCQYTLQFLEAYLNGKQESKAWLKYSQEENGIGEELISIKRKEAQKNPYSFQEFHELAIKQDYQRLGDLYKEVKAEHPELEIPEGGINNLGLQLLFNPPTSQKAIKVFELAVILYPTSANLYDSLAEAYLFTGKKEKAIQNFKKSLEFYDQNQNAIKRLKELGDGR